MKQLFTVMAGLLLLGAGILDIPAATIVFGDPPTGGNGFPFRGPAGPNPGPGTRYQQVYESNSFSGPVFIEGITFFRAASGDFREADYSFTLSTSNFAVNALDTVNLENNPGADAGLFANVHLAGSVGATFTIGAGDGAGGTKFLYDPAAGDLLLDMEITNIVAETGSVTFAGRNGDAGGQFSRAHNFDSGFSNYGLKTQFLTSPVPEPSRLLFTVLGLATVLLGRKR